MQHIKSSTLHTLSPSGALIKGLVKGVKVALNEKYEFFPRKIGALWVAVGLAVRLAPLLCFLTPAGDLAACLGLDRVPRAAVPFFAPACAVQV